MTKDAQHTLTLLFVAAFMAAFSLVMLTRTAKAGEDCDGATHCVLLGFRAHHTDAEEPPAERGERLLKIAQAIDAVSNNATERAWLAITARNESHLARFVDIDDPKCREGHGGRCDGGKAWSIWQLHATGRDGTREDAARIAIERFRRSANYCRARGHDYWEGGTSLYATGNSCSWPGAKQRVREMWAMTWRMQ